MRLPPLPSQTSAISVSGANAVNDADTFQPRLPSTWPVSAESPDASVVEVWKELFQQGILAEIDNVIGDAMTVNRSLSGRGHVVALAMMCALDSLSQFAYQGVQQHVRIAGFIERFFPPEFHPLRADINDHYRNCLIHEWFMTAVAFEPLNEPLRREGNGTISMGLLTFRKALHVAVDRFIEELRGDQEARQTAARRYRSIHGRARR